MDKTYSELQICEKYSHGFVGKLVWKTLLTDKDVDGSFSNGS